jgi:hypothetical protein
MFQKLKSYLADDAFFYGVLIILVGVVSFGLGRFSVQETLIINDKNSSKAEITVLEPKIDLNPPVTATNTSQIKVVGSKSGTKYHLPDCPGAKQMKEANKIYFDSVALAAAAGYTPAGNCPGI